ncbi:TatD family hydrolase [Candidatus Wolfebacteria bacterium]|nr:TatD family hydrolase [Candidatus Wolfebacteria bacterium]
MLIDTHAHLNLGDFKNDYKEAVQRALKKGVWLINVGTDFKNSKRAVEIADEYEKGLPAQAGVFAAIGVHSADSMEDFNKENFLELAKNKKVVAVGECGLDYYRIKNNELRIKNLQKELFLKHIELANEIKKPLIIHCRSENSERASHSAGRPWRASPSAGRDAHDDILKILKENQDYLIPERAGIMHFFGGDGAWENIDQYLNLGFYISFSGIITFPKYSYFEDIARLPLNRILIETDAPFAAPQPYRGQRNEPVYIIETAKKMAEILRISFEEVCEITTENAKKIFQIT